jgi:hypothetical protein
MLLLHEVQELWLSCFFFFTKYKNDDFRASSSSSQSARTKSNNFREERNKKAYDLPAPETPMMIMARDLPIFHSILLLLLLLPCSVSFSSSVPIKYLSRSLSLSLRASQEGGEAARIGSGKVSLSRWRGSFVCWGHVASDAPDRSLRRSHDNHSSVIRPCRLSCSQTLSGRRDDP